MLFAEQEAAFALREVTEHYLMNVSMVQVLAYFGDGATSKGDFHEALNFAGVFKVPAVFVCQNNQWAISVPRTTQTATVSLAQKAVAYGFEGVQVDGMDVLAVHEVTRAALEKARRGDGPTLIEAVCYRFGPHTTADDPGRYRDDGDVAKWRALDPLSRMRAYLTSQAFWDDAAEARLWEDARGEVAQAVDAAEAEPASDPGALFEHAYANPPGGRPGTAPGSAPGRVSEMAALTMVEALNHTLAEALEHDPRIVIVGEDVGRNGGVFRVTEGLHARFGPDRVIDTPLAESAIVGAAIGMAAYGLRPIVEIQFAGFLYPAFDQIAGQAARLRARSTGRFGAPLVIRAPYGGGIRAPELHSDSIEALFVHTPGLKVVIPSSPAEARGLLSAAIADPDPVIFLEPMPLYRAFREEVIDAPYLIPLGTLRVVRPGTDVSVVTWGAMVPLAMKAAEAAAQRGIGAEVLDLRSLAPLDVDSLDASVRKTTIEMAGEEPLGIVGFVSLEAGVSPSTLQATPIARRVAKELGVQITQVKGTGPDGRVTEEDVRAHVSRPLEEERIPLRGLRKRITERMVQSAFTAPHVTAMEEADVTNLVALRERAQQTAEAKGIKLTFLPFIVRAVVIALKAHPLLNASLDLQAGAVVLKRYYHLGIATATEEGLLVPVIRDADKKDLWEIARELARLTDAARARTIGHDDLRGSTFTISNYGAFGGLFATPIINPPEVAILGVGRIQDRPVVRDGHIVVRKLMGVSLSFDHRAVDGEGAGRFLSQVIESLATPDVMTPDTMGGGR